MPTINTKPPAVIPFAPKPGIKTPSKAVLKHRELCPICMQEREDEFYADYLLWLSKKKLAEKYTGENRHDIDAHVQVYRLRARRLGKTEAVYEAIIEEGLERLKGMEFKPGDIIAATQRLDKLTGRDIDRHSFEHGPPKLIMIGIPTPGGVTEREEAGPVFEGQVLQDALPSFNGSDTPGPSEAEANSSAEPDATDEKDENAAGD